MDVLSGKDRAWFEATRQAAQEDVTDLQEFYRWKAQRKKEQEEQESKPLVRPQRLIEVE